MIKIRKTKIDDIAQISPHIRKADREEGIKSNGQDVSIKDIIFKSVTWSVDGTIFTALEDDDPIAIFGIGRTSENSEGIPWLICTDRVSAHPVKAIKLARRYINSMERKGYKRLANIIDPENREAIKFIEKLGFILTEKTMNTLGGHQFTIFERFKNV